VIRRLLLVLPSAALLLCATPAVLGATTTASAGATTLYAYAAGGATSPTSCPRTTTKSQECTLAAALSLAKAGESVALATPGKAGHYVGNWSVTTSGTSSSAPLTIKPAPGVTNPTLDGNHGKPAGCQTKACDGPVLTIGSKVHVDISGLTIQNGDNTVNVLYGYGGAIQNDAGGTLSVSACMFSKNTATDGGAIDNADKYGTGTVTVSRSTFTANSATGAGGTQDGGAIDNADNGGTGSLTVSGSTFTANTATVSPGNSNDGGAIDNADNGGTGSLTVSGSTFSGNSVGVLRGSYAGGGGAIDNTDNGGKGIFSVSDSTFSGNSAHYGGAVAHNAGTGTVSDSTFSGNLAGYGGAICNGWGGSGTLSVSGSTFSANRADALGGAIDNGNDPGSGFSSTLSVSASTFFGDSATGNSNAPDSFPGGTSGLAVGYGGAIDNEHTGTLAISGSTFSADTAKNGGGAMNNFDLVWAAADIFNGPCNVADGVTWKDEGYNVGKDASCLKAGTGDVSHGAGLLGSLAHNGGPTETMMPLAGNPAIGVVPLNTNVKLNGRSVKLCPTIDQRGVHSAAGKACNAGAVQSSAS